VRRHREAAALQMMKDKHPEAELAAVDSHFVNPFSSIKKVSEAPAQRI
jgi:hypothetical protein